MLCSLHTQGSRSGLLSLLHQRRQFESACQRRSGSLALFGGRQRAARPAASAGVGGATDRRRKKSSTARPVGQGSEGGGEAGAASAAAAAPWLSVASLRKVSAAGDANEAMDVLLQELGVSCSKLSEGQCRELIAACLERGNVQLAQSIFAAMTAVAAGSAAISFDGGSRGAGFWPAATIDTAIALVIGLSQALYTREAIQVINSVRNRGLPTAEDVHFGFVVDCPGGAVGKPLTVVQPQEGTKVVADSYTRYEYEVFSGTVTSASSESLVNNQSWLAALARRAGIVRKPPTGAVHTMVVQTPMGQQRTFRFCTATADVPGKVGDRVTVVCSPQRTSPFAQRRLLSASPPGTKPGEALSVSNHTSSSSTALQPPTTPGSSSGLPSWALPVTVLLVGSDVASSLIDPALPYLAAGALAATLASGVAANNVLLPRLKQLPERLVEVAATRQRLLKQHTMLDARIRELVDGAVEDVRMLARMWQLQNKMAAAGGEGAYDARLDRVAAARANLEQRLQKRVELVDAYARVINMIEIEVEMDTQLPAAEVLGIEEQISRLIEIEGLQEEWRAQAEAQDEVERMLRQTPA